MPTEELNIGDVVRLKSGSPKMTITGRDSSRLYCKWFEGSNLYEGNFPPEALRKVSEEKQAKPIVF
jgi:uncharacterized protein YodC (DUF2158 family)